RWEPVPRPADPGDPARGTHGRVLLDRTHLRERVVDPRFGPVLGVIRDTNAPFAMSSAVHPDAKAWGYGRAPRFDRSEPLAVLEVYERLAGFPHHGAVLTDTPYADLRGRALDPASLGGYTAEQLAHPMSRVLPGDAGTPRDWVWGHRLRDGEPVLVPAEVGFYQYEYTERMARHRARRAPADRRRRHFQPESSSGCALGSSLEEAALHSLFELAERDAFLLAFHRARPLPALDPGSLDDPVSRMLLDSIEARGYDAHLLVITQDIDIPAVWALAVHRGGGYPATWSAAGSGADPAGAVRGALWELAQLVREPADRERADAERLLADPYRVDVLEDHYVLYSLPQTLPRITTVLGGPAVGLHEAFPEAAERFRAEAAGDVLGALRRTERLYADAGLDTVVIVDQTTREHTDLGLAVAKAVVPGIVPMCFGHAQQRLTGLPRLERALAEAGRPVAAFGIQRREPSNPYNDHRGYASVRSKFPVHAFVTGGGRRRLVDPGRHALLDMAGGGAAGEPAAVVLAGRFTHLPDYYRPLRGPLTELELGINLRALAVAMELFGVEGRLRLPGADDTGLPAGLGLAPAWQWTLPLVVET
ncbi:hypothetical protein EF912_36500, partial [Streptomyces sp. WAC07061]|uniref:YcaO-like family protein n=1 Tax=Streptomyces sp. WAC07061 TaxID=2487410 RepID=UPI000F7933FA